MSLPPPTSSSTVLITGASSGIGAELARELARRGYNLTLVARRRERLEELAEEYLREHGVVADVIAGDLSKPATRKRLIATLHVSDLFVAGVCNNAGFGSFGAFHDLSLEREVEQVRLNVEALHQITGAFLPEMVLRGTGAVLNVGSVAGFQPIPLNATYAATKAFVNSFSEAVHSELADTGVSCTVLCPGPVKTEFGETAGAGEAESAAPDFMWDSPDTIARAGVEGMVNGRRTVVPGLSNQAAALAGRFTPRSLLLPLARYGLRRGLGSSSESE